VKNKLPKQAKDLLIVGCGRSGTSYISKLWKNMGLDINHERYGAHGLSNWYFTPGHQMTKGPFGAERMVFGDYDYKCIFHQVRHPLSAISSVTTLAHQSWNWLSSWVPIEKDDSLLKKSMKYWHHWNILAENMAELTYQVEQIDEVLEELCNRLGKSDLFTNNNINKIKKMPSDINSREHDAFSWKDLQIEDSVLCEWIKEQAKRYGYSIK